MKTLCIIPARGGSVRVPFKNIAPVNGRPCLAYTVDAIREAKTPMTTVVITDHPRTAGIATGLGLTVIDEPDHLAGGDVREVRYFWYALSVFEKECLGPESRFDNIVIQYPCVPIKPKGIIDRMVGLLLEGADIVQTVFTAPTHFHPYRAIRVDDEKRMSALIPGGTAKISQDYPPMYFNSGAGTAYTRKAMKMLYENDYPSNYESPEIKRVACIHELGECVEIDEPEDVEWAEFVLTRKPVAKPFAWAPS